MERQDDPNIPSPAAGVNNNLANGNGGAARRTVQAIIDLDIQSFELTAVRVLADSDQQDQQIYDVIKRKFAGKRIAA